MRKSALCAALVLTLPVVEAQNRTTYTGSEQAILDRIKTLRSLPDAEWVKTVGELARGIQQLPASSGRTSLIRSLGNVCTEGDAGRESLQIIADTMVQELAASPRSSLAQTLAQLVRYEHLKVTTDNPAYQEAMAKLETLDQKRRNLDFTLTDINGKQVVDEGSPREGRAAKLLGYVVPAVPPRDARYGGPLPSLRTEGTGDPCDLR
jgi:hypothetical protein